MRKRRKASAGSLAGAVLLLAYVGCDSPADSGKPGMPARLVIVSGDRQEFTVGEQLPGALVVRVEDGNGDPVANQVVNFRVIAGAGSVVAGTSTTDGQGLAQDRWILGPVAADTQRVEATLVYGGGGGGGPPSYVVGRHGPPPPPLPLLPP